MSFGIHTLLRTLQLLAGDKSGPTVRDDGEMPETPVVSQGNEHGSVYFNLEWQTRQANDRQQQTNDTFAGENPPTTEQTGDDDGNFANVRQTNSDPDNFPPSNSEYRAANFASNDFRENHSSQNNFQTPHDASFNDVPNRYTNNANYSGDEQTNDFQNDAPVFHSFQNQSEDAGARFARTNEPRFVEVEFEGGTETSQIPHFDQLVSQMESLNLTPREFAETLPRGEREAFLARFQTSELPSAAHVSTPTIENTNIENKQTPSVEIQGEKLPAQTLTQTTAQIKNPENLTARTIEPNNSGTVLPAASDKTAEAPKNVVLADKSYDATLSANLKTPNNATNPNGAEILNARALTSKLNNPSTEKFFAAGDNATRRETGVVLGGALINGVFAHVGEHEQREKTRLGDAFGSGNYFDARRAGFAAGATAALLSAAIGRVIPGAGTDVSGVLGFVSGVVVGVEINEGLRWLGAAKNAVPTASESQLNHAGDNQFNSQLLLDFA